MELDKKDGKNTNWYTFCPHEVKTTLGIELYSVFGDDFVTAYRTCVEAYKEGKLTVVGVHKVRDLFKHVMRTHFDSGLPYIAFIDEINRENPNNHVGDIPSVNLCVAPETLILTDKGHVPIGDVVGENVNVWNGEEWSKVTVVQTGKSQPLVKVTTLEGSLWCTEYHKFYLSDGTEVQARNLKEGDGLLHWTTPEGEYVADNVMSVESGRIDDTYCFTEPKRHMGVFNGILTGQCTESFSTVIPDEYAHSCNLASIVVGRCKDLEEVKYLSGLLARALDNGIELSRSPVKEAHDHSRDFRTVGIGIQGLHDWLAKEHLSYKDHTALSCLAEAIQYGAVKESIKLAEERGAYTHFQGSKWDTGEMLHKYKSNPNSVQDWSSLEDDLSHYGIRNSQLTSPAPNTTTSIFMDAGAGVMPVYMDFYQKDNGNGTFPFASMYLKENPLSYAKNASKWEHIHLIKSVSAVQQWTCAGVSAEFFLDHNKPDFNAKELYDLIHNAWEHKMKTIYYIRHIKKGKQYHDAIGVLAEATCDGCSG